MKKTVLWTSMGSSVLLVAALPFAFGQIAVKKAQAALAELSQGSGFEASMTAERSGWLSTPVHLKLRLPEKGSFDIQGTISHGPFILNPKSACLGRLGYACIEGRPELPQEIQDKARPWIGDQPLLSFIGRIGFFDRHTFKLETPKFKTAKLGNADFEWAGASFKAAYSNEKISYTFRVGKGSLKEANKGALVFEAMDFKALEHTKPDTRDVHPSEINVDIPSIKTESTTQGFNLDISKIKLHSTTQLSDPQSVETTLEHSWNKLLTPATDFGPMQMRLGIRKIPRPMYAQLVEVLDERKKHAPHSEQALKKQTEVLRAFLHSGMEAQLHAFEIALPEGQHAKISALATFPKADHELKTEEFNHLFQLKADFNVPHRWLSGFVEKMLESEAQKKVAHADRTGMPALNPNTLLKIRQTAEADARHVIEQWVASKKIQDHGNAYSGTLDWPMILDIEAIAQGQNSHSLPSEEGAGTPHENEHEPHADSHGDDAHSHEANEHSYEATEHHEGAVSHPEASEQE